MRLQLAALGVFCPVQVCFKGRSNMLHIKYTMNSMLFKFRKHKARRASDISYMLHTIMHAAYHVSKNGNGL